MQLPIDPARTLDDLNRLADFGRFESGVNRRALTPEDIAARAWLHDQMLAAGLRAEIDGIGNVIGSTPGAKRYLVIGSHTDTVPNGGWLDGAMGVMFGLELARALVAAGGADTGIKVISFNDEEGRFAGLLGSSVFCGLKSYDQIAALRADDGSELKAALTAAGYAGRPIARIDPKSDVAYLEAHIEQGPLLESGAKKIGIVTHIVGVARCCIDFHGQADHAGTTPMAMRRDAAAALYEFAVRFATYCREQGSPSTVWNLGNASCQPGAYNVVAQTARVFVEYRDGAPGTLARIRAAIPELANAAAAACGASCTVSEGVHTAPADMHPGLIRCIETAAERRAAPWIRMPSGAGHDAMLVAPQIPTAMLFVPSIGGRSHDIAEDTSSADISLGLEVFADAVADLLERNGNIA